MIRKIQLNNFRNHKKLCIDNTNTNQVIVLYGENGIGKTNILEAISVFSVSNGLRHAKAEDMVNRRTEQKNWYIQIETNEGEYTSGYSCELHKKRIYKVNDKNTKNLNDFRHGHYILWMTYETDRIFMQTPAHRRDFIDMFCNAVYSDHMANIRNYEKCTKERLQILKRYDDVIRSSDIERWIGIIETKIVNYGIKVAETRSRMASILEQCQIKNDDFPRFKSKMVGKLETQILTQTNSEEMYKCELFNRRQKDKFSGSTTLGANRSDWQVLQIEKDIEADKCSAGEQKMLLLCVFFSFILHNLKNDTRDLIILLDDVITHLDDNHRNLLFRYIREFVTRHNNVSVWLSGTNKELFDELKDIAMFVKPQNDEKVLAGVPGFEPGK